MSTATLFMGFAALAAGLLLITLRRAITGITVAFTLVAGTYAAAQIMPLTPRQHSDVPLVLLSGVIIGALFAIFARAAERQRRQPQPVPKGASNGPDKPPL